MQSTSTCKLGLRQQRVSSVQLHATVAAAVIAQCGTAAEHCMQQPNNRVAYALPYGRHALLKQA